MKAPEQRTLCPEHVEWLRESAIDVELALRAGWYSEHDAKAAAKLFGRTPKQWAEGGHLPVLVIPYRLPFQRDPVLFRGRPMRGFETPKADGSVSVAKYVQAKGTATAIFFGPSLLDGRARDDVSVPLWITEGEKKALSAEAHGLSCVALPGVSQWHVKGEKTLHPYFAHLRLDGREVFVAFDADALTNKDVMRERTALGYALEDAGARVRVAGLPQDAPKLDDFFARHERTELDALIADARERGKLPPRTSGTSDEDWRKVWPHLVIDRDSDLPVKSLANMVSILSHHPDWEGSIAYDARWDRQVFTREPPFKADRAGKVDVYPRALTDVDAARLRAWFAEQKVLGWTREPSLQDVEQAISTVAQQHSFDAVQRYLKRLTWDGEKRLDTAASVYFGAAPTRYNETIVAKWLLSAVARARTPGCQADNVLVLEGLQGIGKSTALKALAGEAHFSDCLPDIETKDALEHCVGPWIVELGELDHLRKSEADTMKRFVSMTVAKFRPAYGRRTVERPRRCVFAGSTNEDAYLVDPTGNRRWWPVKCGKIDLAAIVRDRDQLWAEAVARVRAGEAWHLDDGELVALAEAEQHARRVVDPWEPIVLQRARAYGGFVTLEVLFAALGLNMASVTQREANRVGAILRANGWRRGREGHGERRRGYLAPFVPHVHDVPLTGNETGTPNRESDHAHVHVVPVVPLFSKKTTNRGEEASASPQASTRERAHAYMGKDVDDVDVVDGQKCSTEQVKTKQAKKESEASETSPTHSHVESNDGEGWE